MTTSFPIGSDGVWVERGGEVQAAPRVLLCDRDGVVIHDRHYLSDPAGVELIDGIVDILAAARRSGIPIALVTNQSGIGRGYFGWDAFAAVQRRMVDLLREGGVRLDAVFACPHHPQAEAPYRHPDPPMRKPNPGMLRAALALYGADPAESLMIGDKRDDMLAAERAGLRRGILVGSPDAGGSEASGLGLDVVAVASVREAVPRVADWIARSTV